jgi:acetyltransferase-like isoleucine patch superfamily enzyme
MREEPRSDETLQPGDFADVGEGTTIERPAVLGLKYSDKAEPLVLGSNCTVRAFSVLYADSRFGNDVHTGHYLMVREHTTVGSRVVLGTSTVIDGQVSIGSFVKIESGVYIPTNTTIGDYVFIGPGAVLTNDRYPLRRRHEYLPQGPSLEDNVTIGAGAIITPGIRIGEGAFVAAGAVVTKDVPAWTLAVGVPARIVELPASLREGNRAKKW